ncbi:alpha/beta fold hydrolase [Granulicella cerasi]|uniref:Alpha/beta fold hydrolase n=1 Tax=Granulicella cerasi TaxID=741063 RepID=A0ABW1ZAP1_9BACT|nr:alpha/beta hydrolase [Granulicella cerasi]
MLCRKSLRTLLASLLFATLCTAASAQSILPKPTDLPPARFAKVFGENIRYYEAGTGSTLVLVHGFGSQALFDWGRVIKPLALHHHVVAIDEIGWGGSDKPAIDYSIQTFADFLGEFLRVKHIDHFALAGESLGGWIVSLYTIEALQPKDVYQQGFPKPSQLILEDAAGHRAIRSKGAPQVPGTLAEAAGIGFIFYDKSLVTPDLVRQNFMIKLTANDGNTQRSLRTNMKLDEETVGDRVQAINIPTLIVWGGNDAVVPLEDGKDYAAKIPGAKLVIVPECGHAPSLEKPKEFLAAVASFLR